jgi:hypothetical protein
VREGKGAITAGVVKGGREGHALASSSLGLGRCGSGGTGQCAGSGLGRCGSGGTGQCASCRGRAGQGRERSGW